MTTVLLSVGDASGDAAAADFVDALRAIAPGLRMVGLGGSELEKRGVELVAPQRDLAIGGIFELASSLQRVVAVWRRMIAALERERPELVVLVDSSGFNLPFARRARRAGAATLYYVAPQVWAWRPGRVRKLAARVDRIAAILPFEAAHYAGTGLSIEFVGHPLAERLRGDGGVPSRELARQQLGVPAHAPVVALLPGSRRNEIHHGLVLQLVAARHVHAQRPDCRFLLPIAASIDRAQIESVAGKAHLPPGFPLEFVTSGSRAVLCACDVVLTKPGTATLEAVLLDRPCVVAGRTHPATAAIARRLVRVEHLALPNLIAARRVVPEFLQERADPRAIAASVEALFAGPARAAQRAEFAAIRRLLGDGRTSARVAAIAKEMLVARDCA
jgi:lipid-A-disaccharide synthase